MLRKLMAGGIAIALSGALLAAPAASALSPGTGLSSEDTQPASIEPSNEPLDLNDVGATGRAILPSNMPVTFSTVTARFGARQAAFLPAGDGTPARVVATSNLTGLVNIIDADTGLASVVALGGFFGVSGIAVAPGSTSSSGFIYVGEANSPSVVVYDIAANKPVERIPVPLSSPNSLTVVPGPTVGSGTLFVSAVGSPALAGVDLETGATTLNTTLPAGYTAAGLAPGGDATPTSGSLLAIDDGTQGKMLRIDIATGSVLDSYEVFAPGGSEFLGRNVALLSGTASGDERVLVTNAAASTVSEYDTASRAVVKTSTYQSGVGDGQATAGLRAVAYDAAADEIYAFTQLGDPGVIDRQSGNLKRKLLAIGSVLGGVGSTGMDTGSGEGLMYAADRVASKVWVYDTKTDSVVRSIPLNGVPTAMTVVQGSSPRLVVYFDTLKRIEYLNIDTGAVERSTSNVRGDFISAVPPELVGGASKVLISDGIKPSLRMVDVTTGSVDWEKILPFSPAGSAFKVGATLAESSIYVAASGTKTLEILNPETGDPVSSIPYVSTSGVPRYVSILPSGQILILENSGVLRMRDSSGTEPLGVVRTGSNGSGITYSVNSSTGATNVFAADSTMGFSRILINAITIEPETLPDAVVGEAYEAEINAFGNPLPTVTISAGLPEGLSFDASTGKITGTPQKTGTYTVTVTAENGVALGASKSYTITVKAATAAPAITTKTLPNGTVGKAYAAQIEATGLEAPSLSLTGGSLPKGLTFNAATGEITGTPSAKGTFTVEFTATNSVGSDSKEFTFSINAAAVVTSAPVITTKTLPGGTSGKAYVAQVKATGVETPILSLSGGALPKGLKFGPKTGKITGTTSTVGTFTIEVTAKNSAGKDSKKFTFKITTDKTKALPCMEPRPVPVFSDTPLKHKFYKEIDWMECMKYATGWRMPTGKPEYRPQLNIERQAMAAFIFRMDADKKYKAPKTSPFADVKTTDKFYREIAWMWEKGYATGWAEPNGKPTFRSLEPLSREAMAAFIYRLEAATHESAKNYKAPKVSPMADMKPGMKFYKEISWMYAEKLTTGNKTATGKEFWPKDQLSRQAMAAFIYRLILDYRFADAPTGQKISGTSETQSSSETEVKTVALTTHKGFTLSVTPIGDTSIKQPEPVTNESYTQPSEGTVRLGRDNELLVSVPKSGANEISFDVAVRNQAGSQETVRYVLTVN